MKKFKNLFSKKTNLIVAIVALIECIILIGMTSFSWIETASSLVIKGDTLWVTDGHNYDYVYNSNENKLVDLSTYFIHSDHFSFAKASSANAKDFYFPYTLNKGTESETVEYRKGDTTDYNVTYYNFNFEAKGAVADFYFETDDIFDLPNNDFTDAEGNKVQVSNEDKEAFLNSFRIAVTVGDETKIYAKSPIATDAKFTDSTTGNMSTKQVTLTALSTACFDTTDKVKIFSSAAGEDGVNVNFKIWLEEQDPRFKAITDKEALLGAVVDIDLKLISQKVSLTSLTFNDYSMSTDSEFKHDRVYYIYTDKNGKTEYYPMVKTQTSSQSYKWVTCDDSGTPFDTIPSDITINDGHFAFGRVKGSSFEYIYKWELDRFDTVGKKQFNAISVTKTSDTESVGYGYWDDTTLARVKFVDRTTYANGTDYNSGASNFIKTDRIYIAGDVPVALKYFADGFYAAYIPKIWLDDELHFEYTKADYYDGNNVALSWIAESQTYSTTYTAIGYSDDQTLDSLSNSHSGIGMWGDVERINVSAELVDNAIVSNSDKLFRVSFNGGSVFMASDPHNPFNYLAYVPIGSPLEFSYGEIGANNKVVIDAGNINNSISTYYLTNITSAPSGLWNLAVVVDGTTDNLINYTLSNEATTGASLTYTTNEATNDMMPVDNHRWVTGDLTDLTLIKFNWKAYSEDKGYVDTVFDYEVNSFIDGIYYLTVTENGTVIPSKTK